MLELTYPRHVHHRGGVYAVVESPEQHEQAIGDGWLDHPDPSWPVPNWPDVYREVSLDHMPDDARIGDPVLDDPAPVRRRGRPPKAGPKPSESV